MPPTKGHLSLLRKRKWEMAFFLSLHPTDSYCSGGARAHRARRLSSKRANTASPRALGPPHAGEGREVGDRRKNPPPFGEKSPCFGKISPFLQAEREKNGRKCIFLSCKLGQLQKKSYFCNRKREASPMPQRKTAAKHPLADEKASRSDVQWRGGGIGRRATLRG